MPRLKQNGCRGLGSRGVTMERHIVGLGGGRRHPRSRRVRSTTTRSALTGKERPRAALRPDRAGGFEPRRSSASTSASRGRGEPSHLQTFPWPPDDLREPDPLAGRDLRQRRQHGEHARDLARARHRRAAARGVGEGHRPLGRERRDDLLVRGRASPTRSGPASNACDCLGFLAGSACPHYDGEEQRRPRYRELVDGGLAAGLAADDGVALHFEGTELARS